MSYDVQVFAQRALDSEDLRRLLHETGLSIEPAGRAAASLTVLRGRRAQYSFTLGLPVPVEAEDVPEDVTAVLLGASYQYELMVEGSSVTETPHAIRFARRLAQASAGAVLDQQTGQVWTRGKLRSVLPVPRGTIDIVELRWYVRQTGTGALAATAWLDLARQFLPEALPRRFGPSEPLSMKLDVDGPEAFVRAVGAETMSVYSRASTPCIDGNMSGGAGGPGVFSHGLSVHREALTDPLWRGALQHLFTSFAAASDAVYASAEVVRGVEWSGRAVSYGPTAERTTYLAGRGQWVGLPPYPVWWSWFGSGYTPLVVDHLPMEQVVRMGPVAFHARGEEPLDRDELTSALGISSAEPGRWRAIRNVFSRTAEPRSAPTWLPAGLLPVADHSDPSLYNPPLAPAATIPVGLGTDR